MTKNRPPLKIAWRPLRDLKNYAHNPQTHDRAQVDALADSIRQFGWTLPILLQADDVIIAGHARAMAAKAMGLTEVPTIQLAHLTPIQARSYRLADNKLAARSTTDRRLVAQELDDLREAGVDLAITGFEPGELQDLLETFDAGDPEPPAQAEQAAPVSRRGDLWVLGEHRLLCGDATDGRDVELLMDGDAADCVITDPPYGVSYVGKTADAMTIEGDDLTGDALIGLLAPAFKLCVAHARDAAAFYLWHASSQRQEVEWSMKAAGLEERQYLTWIKHHFAMGRADYQWQTEPCFYASKSGRQPRWHGDRTQATAWRVASQCQDGEMAVSLGNGLRISDGTGNELFVSGAAPKSKKTRRIRLAQEQACHIVGATMSTTAWEVGKSARNPDHPTTKPAELATIALHNSTRPGQIVLDLFAGAGFVMLGAEKIKRKSRLMEIAPGYCDVICRRWSRLTGKSPIRLADDARFKDLEAA